jgi:hypothetical protein
MPRLWFIAVIVLLASTACLEVRGPDVVVTAEPQAAELQGARWQKLPIEYCIVKSSAGFTSTDEFRSLTSRAFAAWGVEVVDDGACGGDISRQDGVNEIGWGVPVEAQGGNEEAGFTRILYRQCSGGCANGAPNRIVEADIIISDDPPERWQTSRCLYSTLLHETGHFLGVPHLDSPAIMAPASSECPQELTQMDRDALRLLYGSD